MKTAAFETPVLLLIFNRPDTTAVVFEAIRMLRPAVLYVAGDGPRHDHPEDVKNCMLAREVTMNIDWPCDIHWLFRETNLGCGKAPASGISWFFDHVEEGIILEDDINPSPDFFTFCSTLLARYRTDSRVMEIGGVNLITEACENDPYDYHFSNHNHTWGWATWRRAWKHFDFTIRNYQADIVQHFLKTGFNSAYEHAHFKNLFDATYYHNDAITWWDYQWEFARRINSGLSVVPTRNLITNIGLGKQATHTLDACGVGANLKWSRLSFPLRHPAFMLADWAKDQYYFEHTFSTPRSRMRFNIEKLVPAFVKQMLQTRIARQAQLPLNPYR